MKCIGSLIIFLMCTSAVYAFPKKHGKCKEALRNFPLHLNKRSKATVTKQKRAVVIVDPFGHNAGELLQNYAIKDGLEPIFIFTSPLKLWPAQYQKFEKLKEKFIVIEHSGKLNITLRRLRAKARARGLTVVAALPGLEGPAIPLFDAVSKRLRLPSNGTELSQARIRKSLTQEKLKDAGLDYIAKAYLELLDSHALDKAVSFAQELFLKGKTVILKPNSGAATTFIFKCKNEAELRAAYKRVVENPYFLHFKIESINIEEQLHGVEYIYDTVRTTVVKNGKEETLSVLAGVWKYNRARSADPLRTDVIDSVEWIPSEEIPAGLREYAEKALSALNIRFGPTHLEIFKTEDGYRVVDFNARLPGSSPLISAAATGFTRDQIAMSVESVVDPQGFYTKYSSARPLAYTTKQFGLVLHLNVYEKNKYPAMERLIDLRRRFGDKIFESKIFPTNQKQELPLTVDLFTPLIKIHLLGSRAEVMEIAAQIKREHEEGFYFAH